MKEMYTIETLIQYIPAYFQSGLLQFRISANGAIYELAKYFDEQGKTTRDVEVESFSHSQNVE